MEKLATFQHRYVCSRRNMEKIHLAIAKAHQSGRLGGTLLRLCLTLGTSDAELSDLPKLLTPFTDTHNAEYQVITTDSQYTRVAFEYRYDS